MFQLDSPVRFFCLVCVTANQVCLLCQVTLCVFVCSQLCLQYQGSVGSDCCHVKASQPVVALRAKWHHAVCRTLLNTHTHTLHHKTRRVMLGIYPNHYKHKPKPIIYLNVYLNYILVGSNNLVSLQLN